MGIQQIKSVQHRVDPREKDRLEHVQPETQRGVLGVFLEERYLVLHRREMGVECGFESCKNRCDLRGLFIVGDRK